MTALRVLLLLMAAAGGAAVVLTRDPKRQAIMLSLDGMVLTLLFLAYQAPDVALSELAVGAAATPLMILVALSYINEARRPGEGGEGGDDGGPGPGSSAGGGR